ncbi:Endonuclease/exonuclease/phosphatase [Mycotypha africana]|uniref:Endonuclease/exonuclease/phosphatase n=1 Tax=Mycotypha africana TaxID=64632 RepID=UPI0023015F7F|nr:Endonuclease/exonuclease/phosphatase [Mycotypha africana]KAI8984390.1 Endonuclease/exonuclease/phosphatase [Mycotypha africana]
MRTPYLFCRSIAGKQNNKSIELFEITYFNEKKRGLYIVAKQRQFRLEAIANNIAQKNYDIVALQEVWMLEDVEYIKEKTKNNLPFAHHFRSGTLGSGLILLSKFPVLSSSYLKFSLAGRPLKVFQGDYFVGKGCAGITVDHPDIGLIDVYTTHLQAGYGLVDDFEVQRITECWQIVQCVRNSAAQGRHVILTGDFNSVPTSLCYQLLKYHGFMTDSWLEVHEQGMVKSLEQFNKDEMTASECIQQFGITCNSPLNTWTQHFSKQPEASHKGVGDRLDYIFYRCTPQLFCKSSKVVMEEYIPGTEMSFSDHFAVHSVFTVKSKRNTPLLMVETDSVDDKVKHLFAPLQQQVVRPNFTNMPSETFKTITHLIEKETHRAKLTSTKHLTILCVSTVMIVIIYAIQIIVPQLFHDSLLASLLTSVISGLSLILLAIVAIISLIVGFVFGKMEQRTLNQFLSDLNLCLEAINHKQQCSVLNDDATMLTGRESTLEYSGATSKDTTTISASTITTASTKQDD